MNKMFFYGSLKKGYFNHICLEYGKNNKFLGNHTIQDYTLYDIGYPIAVKKEGIHINGEIWLIDDYTYSVINRMEIGAGYKREVVDGYIMYTQTKKQIAWYEGYCGIRHIGSNWPQKEKADEQKEVYSI